MLKTGNIIIKIKITREHKNIRGAEHYRIEHRLEISKQK